MTRPAGRRHIRDIAHLYLSRMRRPGGGGLRLIVAGISADVIPGFHVANLALAAAARGISTSIEDRSGLPANAGAFLGLHPSCWVPRRRAVPSSVAAFARVTLTVLTDGEAPLQRSTPAGAEDGIEIVHVPPWEADADHARAIAVLLSGARPASLLYLAQRDDEPRPWRSSGETGGATRHVAFVTRAEHDGAGDERVGTFTRWERCLTDPLPVVVRDPGSRLSRQYTEALSVLLSESTYETSTGPGARIDRNHGIPSVEPR